MKKIIYLILILIQIYFSKSNQTDNDTITKIITFDAVYRIDSKINGYVLKANEDNLEFTNKIDGRMQSFRIIPSNSNLYYIESKLFNKRVGINDKNDLILIDKTKLENYKGYLWNIIELNNDEFLIQNNYSKKLLENSYENKWRYQPKCINNINNLSEIIKNETLIKKSISKSFKFSFFKLCEEVKLKPEHIGFIEKEPVDILIKYIDLNDKNLDRKGIKQIKKDEDNEELRYSVRSIFKNIPWIRKIFILMPNEKVKYFKPINEISDKFVYVKDKDLLGFDSADSQTFQLNLHNMTKFDISENFILIDDDYFFGKPIPKTSFFYYDEDQKKVLPCVVTDDFSELKKEEIEKEYNKLFRRRNSLKPHSFFGWKISQLASFKLLLNNFKSPLVNAGFNHNAIPLNINDLKEIYELIKNKYEYPKEALHSIVRPVLGLQPQSLFNSYALNVKKRKVNSIPWIYYDLGALEGKNFDIELFVINTSGDRIYPKNNYERAKNILKNKFNEPTPYEISNSENNQNNQNNENNENNENNKNNKNKKQ